MTRKSDSAKQERRSREAIDEPGLRDVLHPGADQRDHLAAEEKLKVAMAERTSHIAEARAFDSCGRRGFLRFLFAGFRHRINCTMQLVLRRLRLRGLRVGRRSGWNVRRGVSRRIQKASAGAKDAAIGPIALAKENFSVAGLRVKPARYEREMLRQFWRGTAQSEAGALRPRPI